MKLLAVRLTFCEFNCSLTIDLILVRLTVSEFICGLIINLILVSLGEPRATGGGMTVSMDWVAGITVSMGLGGWHDSLYGLIRQYSYGWSEVA